VFLFTRNPTSTGLGSNLDLYCEGQIFLKMKYIKEYVVRTKKMQTHFVNDRIQWLTKKSVHFVGPYNICIPQCTVQKTWTLKNMHIDDREKRLRFFPSTQLLPASGFSWSCGALFEQVPRLVPLTDKHVLLSSSLHNLHALWRPRASGRCSLHLEPSRSRDSLMALDLTPASHPHQDTKRKNNTNQRNPLLKTSPCHPLAKPVAVCKWW